jgi:addiction module RelE/StbE family toxin
LKLLRSAAFIRQARRLVRKNPGAGPALRSAVELLADDPFHPRLRTHKLKGKLASSWACSVAYDLRIVFELVEHEGEQAILLESIGSHDEVY